MPTPPPNAPNSVQRRQSPEPCRSSPTLTPFRAERRDKTAKHCPRDTHNHGTELAMKVLRQARLELSGGSTPDLLRPQPPLQQNPDDDLNMLHVDPNSPQAEPSPFPHGGAWHSRMGQTPVAIGTCRLEPPPPPPPKCSPSQGLFGPW